MDGLINDIIESIAGFTGFLFAGLSAHVHAPCCHHFSDHAVVRQ